MAKKNGYSWLSTIGTLAPGTVLLVLWQSAATNSSSANFFFSSPIEVVHRFIDLTVSGQLLIDSGYTLLPLLLGLSLGMGLGTALGFLLHLSPRFARVAAWNIVILSSVPIF